MVKNTILLFGMPRSGTTWLGKLFDSHPSTLYRHEPDSWSRLERVPIIASAADTASFGDDIRQFCGSMASISALKVCGKTPVFPKSYFSPWRYKIFRGGVIASQLAGRIGIDLPVPGAPKMLTQGIHLVWKSIESIGRFGLVLDALPDARGILLIRHPCGYVASVLRGEAQHRFQDNRGASEDYGILELLLETELARERDLDLSFFQSLHPEERLAWRWVLFNDQAIRNVRASERCRVLRYEDLCVDPVGETRANFEFTGLDWSPQTESFVNLSTAQDDSAYYSVFKDPKKSADKWRDELDSDKAKRIIDVVTGTAPGSLFADSMSEFPAE